MSFEVSPKGRRRPVVKQDFHASANVLRDSASCLRTAATCHAFTSGYHSRNSLTVAPLSMFSKRAYTGTRVPMKGPVATDLAGITFHRRTVCPVRHKFSSFPSMLLENRGLNLVWMLSRPSSAQSISHSSSSAAAPRILSLPVTMSLIRLFRHLISRYI